MTNSVTQRVDILVHRVGFQRDPGITFQPRMGATALQDQILDRSAFRDEALYDVRADLQEYFQRWLGRPT